MAPDLADHEQQRGPSHRRQSRPAYEGMGTGSGEQTGSKTLRPQNPSVAKKKQHWFLLKAGIWNEAGKMGRLARSSYRKQEECPCPSNVPPPGHLYNQSLPCSENRRFFSEILNQEGSGHRGTSNGCAMGGLRMNALLEGQGCLPQSSSGMLKSHGRTLKEFFLEN